MIRGDREGRGALAIMALEVCVHASQLNTVGGVRRGNRAGCVMLIKAVPARSLLACLMSVVRVA